MVAGKKTFRPQTGGQPDRQRGGKTFAKGALQLALHLSRLTHSKLELVIAN